MKAKRRESEVKKPILILGIAFIVLGCSLGVTSLAWFMNPTNRKTVEGIEGQATGNYFDGGDGSKESPYGISTAKQLYYFNWLQDLGYFNKDANNDNTLDKQYYFVLKKDIDASDYTLPPAGTAKYPFLGHFDGAGYKISNLTISNTKGDDKSGLSKNGWPSDADDKVAGNISVVGFFGIVGENDIISGENLTSLAYTVDVNEVEDLYFDNLTVETSTDSTLIGLIAGYANGKLTNCGVHKGKFNFQNSSVGVITNSTEGNPLKGNDKLSKYSLIGAYNSSHFEWKGIPQSDKQTGGDWGGSIDLSSLSKRINYIAKSKNNGKTPGTYSEYNAFNASLYYYIRGFDWDTTYKAGQYAALQSGTYLPLNIDLAKATISGSYTGEMGSYYTSGSNSAEPILDSNTGYITGKNSGSNATPHLHSKYFDSSTDTGGIQYSIYQTDSKNTNYSKTKSDLKIDETTTYSIYDIFQPSNISFFYADANGNSYRISDDDNSSKSWSTTATANAKNVSECGFGNTTTGYYKVKKNFAKMLSDQQTDTIIGANTINLNSLQMYKSSTMSKSTYTNVKINDSTSGATVYDSYEMLDGGINFALKQSGSMKIVIGAYATGTDTSVLPAIYKVNRSSDGKTILDSGYRKITNVYSKTSNGKTTYYYKYGDNTSDDIPSDATEVCNLQKLYDGCFKKYCAYYVEIPLNAGDYWFGANTTKNDAGFVLYLDIGSNAGESDSGGESDNTIPPIDFVYYSDTANKTIKPIDSTIEKTDDDGKTTTVPDYTPSKVTFAISGKPTSVYFYRSWAKNEDNEDILVVYYCNLTGETLAPIEVTGTGTRDEGTESGYETSN